MKLGDIKAWVIDLLFPPKCVFCQRIMPDGKSSACSRCQKELPFTTGSDVFLKGEFFDTGVAPFFYKDNVRESVLRFKFNGLDVYSEAYGSYMSDCVLEHIELPDIVTWVPVSKQRKRERGYDQAYLLAESISRKLEIPVISTLRKTVHNTTQSSIKDKDARKANVLGVYEVTEKEAVIGKKILLVDDVFTTGATVSECSRMLLTNGAENVSCAVFARR